MIKISSILEEIVEELKLRFDDPVSIISAMDTGVSFINSSRLDTKFALIIPPMMGLEDNSVGLAVVKFGYFKRDIVWHLADPQLIDKIENRVSMWLDHHCLKSDWDSSLREGSNFKLDESD